MYEEANGPRGLKLEAKTRKYTTSTLAAPLKTSAARGACEKYPKDSEIIRRWGASNSSHGLYEVAE